MVVGLDGQPLYANHAFTRRLGYSIADLSALHVCDLRPPESCDESQEISAATRRGECDNRPLPLRSKSGEHVAVVSRAWRSTWHGEPCLIYVAKDRSLEQAVQREFDHLFPNDATLIAAARGLDGTFTDINEAFLQTLGYDRDEVIGHTCQELGVFVDPEGQRRVQAKLREGGRLDGDALQVRCRDGSVRDGLFYCRLVDDDATPTVLAALVDVTESKRANEALRAVIERLDATLRALPDLVFRVDRDGRIYDCHSPADERYYVSPSLFLGKRFADVLPSEAAQAIGDALNEAALHGQTHGTTYSLHTAEGVRWFELSVAAIGSAGRPGGQFIVRAHEITDQYTAEQALRASEERYRLLTENSVDVVFQTSREGTITWLSPSVTDLLGWRPEDLLGRPLRSLLHPDDRLASGAGSIDILAGTDRRFEARVRRRAGNYRWLRTTVRPILDETGAILGASGSWHDIEAEVQARAALQHSEARLRGTLDSLLDPHILLAPVRDATGRLVDFEYTYANSAACRYYRMTREDLIGARLLNLLPRHRDSGLLEAYTRVVATGQPLVLDDFAYEQELRGGQERRYDIRGVRSGDGLSVVWRDVTERHDAEDALRQRVTELAALHRLAQLLVENVDVNKAISSVRGLLTTVFFAQTAEVHLLADEHGEILLANDASPTAEAEAASALPLAEHEVLSAVSLDGSHLLAVPLLAHNETLGVLLMTRWPKNPPFSPGEQSLAHTAGDLLSAVLWIARLRVRETEAAANAERQRIARDLHDAVTQNIHAAAMFAEALPLVWEHSPEQGKKDLETIRRLIRGAFAELRIMLCELRPETLAAAPLEQLFERLRDALVGRDETAVDLAVEPGLSLPEEVRTGFYRIAQEALNNVGKYADASHVELTLGREETGVRLTVRDDGRGFEPAVVRAGMGRGIMRERAEAMGADLAVTSAAGMGTTVSLVWPGTVAGAGAQGNGRRARAAGVASSATQRASALSPSRLTDRRSSPASRRS